MTPAIQRAFLSLAILQALHSIEEYRYALWEVLAPARYVSGLVSTDLSLGFAILNSGIVALAFCCYLGPVRRDARYARGVVWFWTVLELANGFGHIGFAVSAGAYFPGLYTAPFLVAVSGYLLRSLLRAGSAA